MTVWREPWDDAPFPDLSGAELDAIVRKHKLGAVEDIVRLPSTGVVNSVYALGDAVVLRVPKALDDALSDVYTESVAVPVAHATGIRTPALLAFDDDRDIVDVPYTLYERVDGSALTDVGNSSAVADVWRELGRDLAVLHHAVADCPDPIDRLDQQGRTDEADELIAAAVAEGAINADNGRQLAAWFEELRPALAGAGAFRRFLHGDVQPANVLVGPGGDYRALIDWGDAGWGDPALDFRSLPARAVPAALAGYRDVAPIDGDDMVEARIWWDHLWSTVYALRRDRTTRRADWSRPPGARVLELLAYVAAGGAVGRFT